MEGNSSKLTACKFSKSAKDCLGFLGPETGPHTPAGPGHAQPVSQGRPGTLVSRTLTRHTRPPTSEKPPYSL